jgi:hypothetical protein
VDSPDIRSASSAAAESEGLRREVAELRAALARSEDALRLCVYRLRAFNVTKDTDTRNGYLADMAGACSAALVTNANALRPSTQETPTP